MATAASPLRLLLLTPIATLLVAASPALFAGQGPSPGLPDDEETIRHVLNRITFGPRPGDITRVQSLGLDAYLDQQLHPERVSDDALEAKLQTFSTLTMSSRKLAEDIFVPALEVRQQQQRAAGQADPQMTEAPGAAGAQRAVMPQAARAAQQGVQRVVSELTQSKLIRAIESERQLQEVLTDFWFNHFNVFVGKALVRQYLTEYERDAIRPHVLGSFRDLLGAVAKSPAMLIYLDNWQSSAPGDRPEMADLERRLNDSRLTPAARQRLTQRLQQMRQQPRATRGLNENYARELLELHTLGVDGGYTQDDVVALARILTGWTVDQPRQGGGFIFRPATHDTGTKTLLGQTFGPSGQAEGEFALDLLASHPSTARHIATKLAQRFIADEPPASVVDRAARVFLETKGDLRAVTRTIVTAPEFFADDARRAKVKTPLEFVVSSVRITGAIVVNAQPLVGALQQLGMPLYGSQPPTGYGATAADWVNTGALLARMNFAVDFVAGGRALQTAGRAQGPNAARIPRPNATNRAQAGPIRLDVEALAPSTDADGRTRVIESLLGGTVSEGTAQTLARAESPQQLVALALGSPEFQRR